jgi:hypothetical protein
MGNDVVTALENLQGFDLNPFKPSLQASTSADDVINTTEDEQYKMEIKADFNALCVKSKHWKQTCQRPMHSYGNNVI